MWQVTSFYRFLPLTVERTGSLRAEIDARMTADGLFGLVLVAPEGVNGTVAGASVAEFKIWLASALGVPDVRFKDSQSAVSPFKRRTVDIRDEIVGLKRPDLAPTGDVDSHLSAREWHERLASGEPTLVIDTRNAYETKLGRFRGSLDPGLKTFSDWSAYLDSAELPRDVPVMLYCTGGIRCEKAILEMREHGFEQVYQLRDGILGYLAEYPVGFYEGECFVFDDRVSLGPDLLPTGNYGICPGCGLTSGQKRVCKWCGGDYFVCSGCEASWKPVCSKTCLDRWQRHGPR